MPETPEGVCSQKIALLVLHPKYTALLINASFKTIGFASPTGKMISRSKVKGGPRENNVSIPWEKFPLKCKVYGSCSKEKASFFSPHKSMKMCRHLLSTLHCFVLFDISKMHYFNKF